MQPTSTSIIQPDWPAPSQVRAFATTRNGGVSENNYSSLNLGIYVNDNPEDVARNRQQLIKTLNLPSEPFWLQQVHGTQVVNISHASENTADAAYTHEFNKVCAILTADCLPILVCDKNAEYVAAIHAGWRGLAAGIIENTLACLPIPRKDLLVWLGPAISQSAYEVGDDVHNQFLAQSPEARLAFMPNTNNRWQADMYLLAKQRLNNCNVENIYGGNYCTYTQAELFFSFRRDGITGRMASLIWLEK